MFQVTGKEMKPLAQHNTQAARFLRRSTLHIYLRTGFIGLIQTCWHHRLFIEVLRTIKKILTFHHFNVFLGIFFLQCPQKRDDGCLFFTISSVTNRNVFLAPENSTSLEIRGWRSDCFFLSWGKLAWTFFLHVPPPPFTTVISTNPWPTLVYMSTSTDDPKKKKKTFSNSLPWMSITDLLPLVSQFLPPPQIISQPCTHLWSWGQFNVLIYTTVII